MPLFDAGPHRRTRLTRVAPGRRGPGEGIAPEVNVEEIAGSEFASSHPRFDRGRVFTVDLEWRITSFNAAAERITGVAARRSPGRHCCDVFRASICETECALKGPTAQVGRW